jgi:hypothetical protein
MKTRMVWFAAIALLHGLGFASLYPASARADNGGQNNPAQTRIRIALIGAVINRVRPEGHAEFRATGTQRQLNIEAEKVNLADGTALTVRVNGAAVGILTLKLGHGVVELNTTNGAMVPVIHKGDIVTVVVANGSTVESGTF